LRRKVCFNTWLKGEALCYQKISSECKPPGHIAIRADGQRRLNVIVIWDQAFNANDSKSPSLVSALDAVRLDAPTNLKIVVALYKAAVENLKINVVLSFESCVLLSFALKPEAVDISPLPALSVPPEVTVVATRPVFEHVNEKNVRATSSSTGLGQSLLGYTFGGVRSCASCDCGVCARADGAVIETHGRKTRRTKNAVDDEFLISAPSLDRRTAPTRNIPVAMCNSK
jgi:hypothetical protein